MMLTQFLSCKSVIWRSGLWAAPTASLVEAFSHGPSKLAEAYSINASRPASCVLGALDFLNDLKFLLPAEMLAFKAAHVWNPYAPDAATTTPGKVYRCIIDEPNPWQPSHGAHHAVDLLLLFGGFDNSLEANLAYGEAPPSSTFVQTGRDMRRRFIEFVNGGEPWDTYNVAAFGPWGGFKMLSRTSAELKMRRRMDHLRVLRRMDKDALEKVFMDLARGRISLLN